MGFGKTVVTLTAIAELLADKVVRRVLILGTKKIITTVWHNEAAKWEHLTHLTVNVCSGDEVERINAVTTPSDILVLNYDLIPWFCDRFPNGEHNCDGLVADEITKLKRPGGAWVKRLRRQLKHFTWRVGLTGTPVSEDYEGLYSLCLVLDDGKRLGTNKEIFLRTWFYPTDYNRYNWALLDSTGTTLLKKIADLMYLPDESRYQAGLPGLHHERVNVTLPDAARLQYHQLNSTGVLLDANGLEICRAVNEAVLTGKLQQVTNGFVYDDDKTAHFIHDAKFKALHDLVLELNRPVVIAYWFQAELERLRDLFPAAVELTGNIDAIIKQWNRREIPVLLVHPRSAGHGIQLEQGGHDLIRLSPQWSNDLDKQLVARLWRQGQVHDVNVYTIMARDTVDAEIVERIDWKQENARKLNQLRA